MVLNSSNSDDFDFEDSDDDEVEEVPSSSHGPGAGASSSRDNGAAGSSQSPLVSHFVGMNFRRDMVLKTIEEYGENEEAVLEALLTYQEIEKSSPSRNSQSLDSSLSDSDADLNLDEFSDADSDNEVVAPQMSTPSSSISSSMTSAAKDIEKDEKLSTLLEMGYTISESSSAINRCGVDASVEELTEFIHDAQGGQNDEPIPKIVYYSPRKKKAWIEEYDSLTGKKKRREMEDSKGKRKIKCQDRVRDDSRRVVMDRFQEGPTIILPKPMVGFGLPTDSWGVTKRKLPETAIGPPYFYYENVALAPKGTWETISRFLNGVQPEFVDSKHFCAAARKRGYIHNLPIDDRFPLQPIPPKTIHEALPLTKRWWPKWDTRTHLNCLQTCIGSAKLTERIRDKLVGSSNPPPLDVQRYVMEECRKWNLVWVGLHKVAPLEPDEIESLLGFPKNHTRGGGISRTDRYKSLGNSFQVDTVAYHLSVLKRMFPHGINVLSLFSGIGGAEVALHRLGIQMKTVVSVEKSEINRNIIRSWWEQTMQTGTLIEFDDVQQLSGDRLEQLINEHGGFDLVIGGSPCNNLSGSNRVSRDGLEGTHSSLFFDYFRILDLVRCIMGRK